MGGATVMLGTKEIASILGVKDVTVRKYAQALEGAGYIFTRIDGKNREYTDTDVMVFKDLVAIRKHSGISIEKGAILVQAKYRKELENKSSISVIDPKQESDQYDILLSIVNEMSKINNEQTLQLERLNDRISNQNANLIGVLNEMRETRRMIAAMDSRKWWQFWRKKSTGLNLENIEATWKVDNE
jgi:DNA-binding transcriptional MerR regulator